ncbi:hypothetical protein [Cysteiniphilum marinum]|uniref:hypothetical protein n=1 Tax=Cysteiniphilum marinum TaxID=2774191 RepID=UPI001939772B|nr:hypothetical protein [Cysteiniphilum marinum]
MNDNQKERLLKIAESNPELAKEMLDFMKDEKRQSNEPIAVKMVKAEEDKIEITAEQKQSFQVALFAYATSVVMILFAFIHLFFINSLDMKVFFISLTIGVCSGVFANIYATLKIGVPIFKNLALQYFKW